MKRFLMIWGWILLGVGLQAQNGMLLENAVRDAVIRRITHTTTRIESMKCRFVQTKTSPLLTKAAVAEGRMSYSSPSSLRWEYVSPYRYTLTVENDSIGMTSDGKTVQSAVGKSGVKYMAGMILGSISGQKLFDERMFAISLYEEADGYCAVMKPKRKDMRRMFGSITFYFAKGTLLVERVELTEGEGTTTTIRFENITITNR